MADVIYSKEHAQFDSQGRRIPDFAPPLVTLSPHPFNREPHCVWCEECFRFEDDEIHGVEMKKSIIVTTAAEDVARQENEEKNSAVQSSEGAPSASHDIGSPTQGAMRAAEKIFSKMHSYAGLECWIVPDMAEVIDRESGLLDLLEALSWYIAFYRDVQRVAPEYFQRCYDLDATEYLFNEAQNIYAKAKERPSESTTQEKA